VEPATTHRFDRVIPEALAKVTTADTDDRAKWRIALGIVVGGALLRLILGAMLPLFPDEAYYWMWSQRPALGYFDHPPMIAWLIGTGAAILGDSPIGVRLFPIVAGSIGILATAATARRIGGGDAAMIAAGALTALPLASAGLVLATPDAPLLATFAVALYAVVRALECPPRTREAFTWWLMTGWALALAFSSKYTSILLPASALIAFALHRDLRPRFAEGGPYAASLFAALFFTPVLFWNARHGWISFVYQIEHGLGAGTGPLWRTALRFEGDLIGGQLALASPILFGMMAMAVWRTLRRPSQGTTFLLAVVSALTFLVFVYGALRKHVEPNWPAPAYVGAMILLATHPWSVKERRWLHRGITVAAVMTAVIYVHAVIPILPLPAPRDPIGRAFGWDSLAVAVRRTVSERVSVPAANDSAAMSPTPASAPARVWVGADRYQDAAEIAFYGDFEDSVFAVNLEGRRNQFDLWPAFRVAATTGDRLVLVVDDTRETHGAIVQLTPFFRSILRGQSVELRRGDGVVGTRRIYSLDGWRGGWPAAPGDSTVTRLR
jgi:4-amino-4-deoxy-L-arabinose transferase-like glycosyltransferase